MSKFSDLKKNKFINSVKKYSDGVKKSSVERVTFTMPQEYLEILNTLSKKDRVSKSFIIRVALILLSRLNQVEKEDIYEEIYNK